MRLDNIESSLKKKPLCLERAGKKAKEICRLADSSKVFLFCFFVFFRKTISFFSKCERSDDDVTIVEILHAWEKQILWGLFLRFLHHFRR